METTIWISRRSAVRLAWSLWAISVTLTSLSLLLLILNLSHPHTHVFDWWLGNAPVVIDATAGAVLFESIRHGVTRAGSGSGYAATRKTGRHA